MTKLVTALVFVLALSLAFGSKMAAGKHGKGMMKKKEMMSNLSTTTSSSTMEEEEVESTTIPSTGMTEEEEEEEEESGDEMMEEEEEGKGAEGGGSKKSSVKNFKCQFTGALLEMRNSIKELDNDIKAIKNQMFEKCPGFEVSAAAEKEDQAAGNGPDDQTEVEEEEEGGDEEAETEAGLNATTLPPIPGDCPAPFHPVASGCFFFFYYTRDWRTWGDADAHCKTLGGTLASPHRLDDLREYLVENFANVFWVGAKKSSPSSFSWQGGRGGLLSGSDWKEGQPSKGGAAKFCVYLEYVSGYKAVNHYCGEKFAFICEKRGE